MSDSLALNVSLCSSREMDTEFERRVRIAAFDYLQSAVDEDGVATWQQLKSFTVGRENVLLVGTGKGIFKPRQLSLPISILTAPPKDGREPPYEDEVSPDGFLLYRYRGTDPPHGDNVHLRQTLVEGLPLIHLHGVDVGRYLVSMAQIVADDPANLTFMAVLAELQTVRSGDDIAELTDRERSYQFRLARQRLHQTSFRQRVLKAYKNSCALCRLKHPELLDAAHIIRDSQGGKPIVPNGLTLCKIHHAGYDANIIGIRPDLVIEIRPDVLREKDGPMLAHGLQGFHQESIWTPRGARAAPDHDALNHRYEEFKAAS